MRTSHDARAHSRASFCLTAGFAVIATTADAVPAISPTGAARMEREKAEAQAKALKKEETLRTECMRENKTTAQC